MHRPLPITMRPGRQQWFDGPEVRRSFASQQVRPIISPLMLHYCEMTGRGRPMSLAVVNSHRADRIWTPARHPSRTDLSGLLGCVLRRRRFCWRCASGRGRGPDGTCGPGGRRHAVRAEAGAGRSGVLEGRLVGGAEETIGATTSRSGPLFDEAVHSSHPDRRAIKGGKQSWLRLSTRRNKRHRNNPSRPGQPAGVSGFSGLSSWPWSSTDTTS